MLFYGYHGNSQEEATLGQRFVVDVELELDVRPAGESDRLGETVNYSHVYRAVKGVMEGARLHLLEAVAENVAGTLLDRFAISGVMVRVKKPSVPLPGPLDYAAVEIYRGRA